MTGQQMAPVGWPSSAERAADRTERTGVVQRWPKAARDRTGTWTRVVARAGWTTGQGMASWSRRAAAGVTYGHIREGIRQAKVAGDRDAVGEWTDRLEAAKDNRQRRLLALPREALLLALLAIGTAVVLALGTAVVAVVAWITGSASWTGYWSGVGSALVTLGWTGRIVAELALVLVVPWLLFVAWTEGKRSAAPPMWLMNEHEKAQVNAEITPSKVVRAFRDLGIGPLAAAIKDMTDGGAGMLSPITIAGRGVAVDVTLPSGVETSQVQERRRRLAENLDRHRHELFITIPKTPRTVRLWIADRGALDAPIGKSPLVLDSTAKADTRTGRAPWGEDLRGDARGLSVYQRHLLVTGLSNQGKTAALRALALWVALDSRTRLWIADLKGPKDWRMFEGLAEELVIGPTDEHVIAATEMVEAAVAEMERRTQVGGTHPPLFVIVDEAQVVYMCPANDEQKQPYGGSKNTSRYFMAARKIHNQGRAVDVVLWEGTQDPTNQNLPKLTREGKHIRASLVVGTEAQAKMALGESAVNAGAAPHELRQGLDKGTLVVAGDGFDLAPEESSLTVRTHFIGDDEAAELAERAKRARTGGRPLRVIEGQAGEAEPDHLAAVLDALRAEQRVRTTVVLGRLAEDDPTRYEGWTHARLAELLAEHDARPVKSDGVMVVRRDRVERALTERGREAETG